MTKKNENAFLKELLFFFATCHCTTKRIEVLGKKIAFRRTTLRLC